jgi:hypothetical protein
LTAELRTGHFAVTKYGEKEIKEAGKTRHIQFIFSYYEKIGIHAVMNIVEDMTFRRLIRTTGASLKNRGVHDLMNVIRRDINENADKVRYVYEDDITKFYERINQDIMMAALRHIFKGPMILSLLECFVRFLESGLSIGLRSSQHFGNLLLSVYLDHCVKDQNRQKFYYRYCDDKRVITETKEDAWRAATLIHKRVQQIELEVKPNYRVYPIEQGIDFLGYVIYKDYTKVRKRNKKRAARRLKRIKSRRRRREIINSFYSLCKHANANNLFYKITGLKMSEFEDLKSLGEIGISSTPGIRRNGQKNFCCREMPLAALVGTSMTIVDFETNVSTKWSRKALKEARDAGDVDAVEKTKYLVCARVIAPHRAQLSACNKTLKKGEVIKFFIGYPDMCDVCDQLKGKGMLNENKVTVAKNVQGSYVEYLFV